jgi:16S rRNA G527 N7-methylase RsmG
VRVLGLKTEVWAARVEEMPDRTFDVVALRAVDHPVAALALARRRLVPGGTIAHLTALDPEWTDVFPFPGSASTGLHLIR